jgi:hypothetical protein
MLQLRCAVLDQRVVDGSFTEYDAKNLAFSNSLSRTLAWLGLEPAAAASSNPRAALLRRCAPAAVEYTIVDPQKGEAHQKPTAPAAVESEVVDERG